MSTQTHKTPNTLIATNFSTARRLTLGIVIAILTLAACSSGGDSAADSTDSASEDDRLASVADDGEVETAAPDEDSTEDIEEFDPLTPAEVATDPEGGLVCAKVEAALISAEDGDIDAINANLIEARERLAQAGPEIAGAGTDLIAASTSVEEWQKQAFDFLDVCASTGYVPFVLRPDSTDG